MDTRIAFHIYKPRGCLAPYVQAVWTASVSAEQAEHVTEWLPCDAGSGVLFNLAAPITLGDTRLKAMVTLLPTSVQSQSIILPPGASIAGIRFHPAMGFGFLGRRIDKPTEVLTDDAHFALLIRLAQVLDGHMPNASRLKLMYLWLSQTLSAATFMPLALSDALSQISLHNSTDIQGAISQRQLERIFKRWMGMTPKHYQRIRRVQAVSDVLKRNPSANLVDLALECGYADQPHMTREFKSIQQLTPGEYSKLLK